MNVPDAQPPPGRRVAAAKQQMSSGGIDRANGSAGWSPEPGHVRGRARSWRDGVEPDSLLAVLDRPAARLTDPATSHVAGGGARARGSRLRGEVLAILSSGGRTDDELAQLLPGEHAGSVSKRRHDLVAAGLVVDSGVRRSTRRGSPRSSSTSTNESTPTTPETPRSRHQA